ncbi:restin homolog [Mya arenaria]|uniref:restin homolog n=1 Tax=Mya arenaria TaxID=6604 RepID=UPI0022E1B354|nr:restin homolog [Mya arenaria]
MRIINSKIIGQQRHNRLNHFPLITQKENMSDFTKSSDSSYCVVTGTGLQKREEHVKEISALKNVISEKKGQLEKVYVEWERKYDAQKSEGERLKILYADAMVKQREGYETKLVLDKTKEELNLAKSEINEQKIELWQNSNEIMKLQSRIESLEKELRNVNETYPEGLRDEMMSSVTEHKVEVSGLQEKIVLLTDLLNKRNVEIETMSEMSSKLSNLNANVDVVKDEVVGMNVNITEGHSELHAKIEKGHHEMVEEQRQLRSTVAKMAEAHHESTFEMREMKAQQAEIWNMMNKMCETMTGQRHEPQGFSEPKIRGANSKKK